MISADHAITDRQTLIDAVVGEVRRLDPAVAAAGGNRDVVLVESKVVTDPRSVFSVTPATERLRPPTETTHSSLFLAGDIVATGWPATMEGAVISGRMAAKAVVASPAFGG